ncbi:Uncharacterized protein APZ42_011999, partial [Daphnia magna]
KEHDVFQYCVAKHSKSTGLQLCAYKAIRDAEQYVSCGWVKDIFRVTLSNSIVIVSCRVHHSQSIRKSLLNPWAAIKNDMSIICSSCDCEAGLGGVCSHVGAMLYKIIAVNNLPCTSQENRWIDTSNRNDLKLFKQLSGMNDTIYKSKYHGSKNKTKLYDSASIPLMTTEEQSEYEKVLLKNKAVQLQVVNKNEFYKHFQPPELPVAFGTIFIASLVGKSYVTVMEECERLLKGCTLSVTEVQSENVNRCTIGQKKTQFWQLFRAGRCTASNAYPIFNANIKKPALWLLKKSCYPAEKAFSTEATRYGVDNENRCITKGCKMLTKRNLHHQFNVTKCGLIISSEFPEVAASPDALFHCKCHGMGVIEAKCSWKHRYAVSLKEVCTSHKDFYLSYDEETQVFNLKKNHPYYYQVQQQLLVTKRKFALFMVYIENDVAVVYVPEDILLCNEIRIRSQFYFREVLLPQLVSDYFYASHQVVTMMEEHSVIEVNTPVSNSQACASQSPVFQAQYAHNNVETAMTNLIENEATVGHVNMEEDINVQTGNQTALNTSHSFYCICQQHLPGEETVICRNVNCIIKVFHKCCIIPQRIR